TGHGALKEIANCNFKTDRIDAYKLALVCKDIWSGRRFIRRTHISSDDVSRGPYGRDRGSVLWL
ncbi:MAG: hypothetical protein J6R75_01240, partial [Candidatus Methanomethylophilaceae archaeon]|nr:hypothetical protein [Candidatus Methanomethylophilaceae archaeon]